MGWQTTPLQRVGIMAKHITVKLTADQLKFLLEMTADYIHDMHDFTFEDSDYKQEAFVRRLMTTLARAKISK